MAKQPFRIDGGLKAGSSGILELDSAGQLQAIPVGLDSVAVTGSIFTLAEVDVANGAAMSAYQVLRWNSTSQKFTADDDSDTFLTGITDASNTALGGDALATGGGTDNVAIGHSALTLSTGSGNVALGDDAGSALVSGDNNVIIGRNDGSSIEGKDGQLIIANGAGSVVMSADSAQKVSFAGAADVAGVLTFGSTTETTDKISEGSVNLYYTRARWDSALGTVSTADVSEGSDLYYTTVRFDSDFSDKTTDDLSEGSTNLYYTETNFDNSLATKTTDDLTEGSNLYYTLARFDSALGTITTDDLTQGSNLYYSDSSFNLSLASKTTDDLTEGTNLYYTLARFDSALGTITTDDVAEGSNQYYTDARFNNAFNAKSTDDLSEGSTNQYYTETRFDTSLSSKTTDDVAEGSTNEYYTVARFDSAFGAKSTADITEDSTALFFTNARAQAAIAGAYTGGTGVTYDSATSNVSIGQPVETTSDVEFGSVVIDERKAIETAEVTTSATAQATIDTFPIADFRSGTYTITVTEGTNYQSTEMLVTHDDTYAYMVEFGTLTTGGDLADFDVAINGTDLEVKATPASANSTEFKIVRHLVGENITTGQGSSSGSGGSGSGGSGSGGSGGGSSSSYSLTTALEADQVLFLDPTDTTNATSSAWTNTASPTNPATTTLYFDVANTTFETSGSTNIGYVMDASSTIEAAFIRAGHSNPNYTYDESRLGSDYDGAGTGDYTLTYWVKTSSTAAHSGGYAHGMGLGGDTNTDGGISSGISNGQIVWSYYSGGWSRAFSTGTVNDGDWHCITMTYNNGSLKMYIDGVLDSTHTGVGYSPGKYVFDYIGTALADAAFVGTMGAIRVFASELTASEVETVFDVEAQQYGLTPIN